MISYGQKMFWPTVFHPVRSIISTIIPMNLTLEVVLELWSDSSRVIHQPETFHYVDFVKIEHIITEILKNQI